LGRKVSAKERAATDAALDVLRTTKNQNLKAQMAKLLFESDAREKARADAREQHRHANGHNKELAGLRSQIPLLKEQLQTKEDMITSLKADNEKEVETLKHQIAGKHQAISDLKEQLKKSETALSDCGRQADEQLSRVASYVGCPEYDRKVLSQYLKEQTSTESRTAALGVIVLDKSLPQDQRRKLAVEITQHHKEARQRQPLKQFVDEAKRELGVTSDEDLEPDYSRWHRSEASDNPVLLLRLAAGLEDTSTEGQRRARRMLALFYGWNNVDVPGLDRSHWERQALFDKVSALTKRSIEEVERNLQMNSQTEKENKRSKEDWQGLVKNDNQRAKDLVEAAASGKTEVLCELQQYRQCSNCAHVSHSDQTHQGHCHHCGRMYSGTQPMEWSPVVKLADVPSCLGFFPCMKI
jgi:hypothetical protein